MRPWSVWLATLGLAGSCLLFAGCGGGEAQDPDSDSAALDGGGGAPPPEPTPAPGPAMPIAGQPGMPGMPPGGGMPGMPPGAAPGAGPAQAPAEAPPAVEPGSTTAEMLAMATGGNPQASDQPAGPGAPGAGGPPGRPGMPGMPPGGPGMMAMRPGGPGFPGGPPPGQGAPGGPRRNKDDEMEGARPPTPPGASRPPAGGDSPGGGTTPMGRMLGGRDFGTGGAPSPPGYRGRDEGMPGGAGPGGPSSNVEATTENAVGAVQAFLNALKARDRNGLMEATALRASTEAASDRNRELFGKIVDDSISDSELDDLAKKLEGYTITGRNAKKSTGRESVVISTTNEENGALVKRSVIVRKEKKGWGVLDVSGPMEFKGMGRRGAAGRNRG